MINKLTEKLGFDEKTFFRFFIIVTNSQLIYAFIALKSVLYEPFREVLSVTNTQLGVLLGIIGFIATFGGAAIGWLQDRFSVRNVLVVNSFMYGGFALIMSLWPGCPFWLKCIFFISFGFNADAMYWASVLKSVRTMAKEDRQATAFGVMESMRGMWEFLGNALGSGIFALFAYTIFGMRVAMSVNSIIIIISGILVLIFIPNEKNVDEEGNATDTKKAFNGLLRVIRMPEVWMTGIAASCVYATFCAVNTYFVPYMQHVYLLPVGMVAIFGLVNGSLTRIVCAPISGIVADAKFKSSAHLMRACYAALAVLLVIALLIPGKPSMVIPAMIVLLGIAVFCFFIRAVFWSPIGELGVPTEVGAAAMAVGSFIGYSPSFWAYPLYGWLIDTFEKATAYKIIFVILLSFAVIGFTLTTLIGKRILQRRQRLSEVATK
ncbi:MAG: MFS transporter [Actinomycetaceae bacterium]|nr:MFS transporter [Actinomycetaceae bacterium]